MANQYKNKIIYGGNTLIDLSGDTVTAATLLEGYTAHDASGAPIIGTASSGGGETVSTAHLFLASGTVDAGITSATIGNGIIDTGLTLADLQAYKYFYYKIRLDDNKPYIGLRIGSTIVSRAVSNGIGAEYTWVDSNQTMIMPISFNVGNSGISGSPARLANNEYYMHSSTLNGQQFLGAISGFSPTDKIYLGCLHMNGLAETTKTMTWAIAGFGGLS